MAHSTFSRKLLSPANVDLLMGSGGVDALVLGHNNSAVSAGALESIAASGAALKGTRAYTALGAHL